MFVITKYVLREHAGPFIISLFTIVFVFLLNVVFRDLGSLLGKGLPAGIVFEFFFLNLAWIIALAVPMAVLIATLMAFGRMSSDNEITALKASGLHLFRLIFPVLIAAAVVGILLERFNNAVLPEFNHRLRLLYSDIMTKKPTLTLEPHVFFNDFDHYSLFVREIEEEGNLLKGIVITDDSDPRYLKTITADRGRVEYSKEKERMLFFLFDGEVHEIELKNLEDYRRIQFEQQVFSIPTKNMELRRSNSEHRGDREKSSRMMHHDIEKSRQAMLDRSVHISRLASQDFASLFPEALWDDSLKGVSYSQKEPVLFRGNVRSRVQSIFQQIEAEIGISKRYRSSIRALQVEIHKKYSIPVACLVFVLVGAPLGIVARQGGFAMGGGLSIIFFLIYWAFLIGGEQLADRGYVDPVVAMWAPDIVVGAAGIILTLRMIKETPVIRWERWGFLKKRA